MRDILHELLYDAELLLDRYRDKAKQLVEQTGGEYAGGEAIQFLVNDYEKHKADVKAYMGR